MLLVTYAIFTDSPIECTLSTFSIPMIRRNSVVFPAPLGPMTPTMPFGGREVQVIKKQLIAVCLRHALSLNYLVT